MKKIKYSITERLVRWGAKEGQKRYSANIQKTGTISLAEFAEHMSSHGSKYNKGDLMAVIIQLAGCVREFLLQGYAVDLGDLGSLSPRIRQKAAESAEAFSASNITALSAGFSVGPSLRGMIHDAGFEYVSTLREQAALNAATKSGKDKVQLNAKVVLASSDSARGTVVPSGEFSKSVGTVFLVRAEPKAGNVFEQWSDGDLSPIRRIVLKEDMTLTATFKAAPSGEAASPSGGENSGGGSQNPPSGGGGSGVNPYE